MLATDELVRKATTTTANLTDLIPELWAAQIERNLRKAAVLQRSLVENTDLLGTGGDTVHVPILPDIAEADDLTEGTDMVPIALSNATSVPLTPAEVGKSVEITRKALDRIKYDGMAAIVDRLSYAMSLKIEGKIAALYNKTVPNIGGSPLSFYANGKTSATITAADIFNDKCIWNGVRLLQEQNNVPFDDGFYLLYITPKQYSDLMSDTDVRQDLRFGSPKALFSGEVGVLHGCRIIVSNYVAYTGSGQSYAPPAENSVNVAKALLVAPRWAAIAWKRRPGLVVDPTLYDMGRRRRFGVTADLDIQLLHSERSVVITSAI